VLELTDSTPGTALEDDVRRVAISIPGVLSFDKCFVRKMGFDYYADLYAIVDRNIPVWQGHEFAHMVKHAIRSAHPEVADVLVHIEPYPGP
jgi:divalent metal cation (Fe/Co/Zn/Cd) transporter